MKKLIVKLSSFCLLFILSGFLLVNNILTQAHTHEDDEIRDGYCVDDICDLLEESFHYHLEVFAEDGSIETVGIPAKMVFIRLILSEIILQYTP